MLAAGKRLSGRDSHVGVLSGVTWPYTLGPARSAEFVGGPQNVLRMKHSLQRIARQPQSK